MNPPHCQKHRPYVTICSCCNITISLEHAPMSLFDLMLSEIDSDSQEDFEGRLDSIKSTLILWMNCEQGTISVIPKDFELTTSHTCQTHFWYTFEEVFEKASLLMYTAMFGIPKSSHLSEYKYQCKSLKDNLPYILLKFSCNPTFSVSQDATFLECCNFVEDLINKSPSSPLNHDEITDAFHTWITHHDGRILVSSSGSPIWTFPPSIRPLVQCISQSLLQAIVNSQPKDDFNQNTITDEVEDLEQQQPLQQPGLPNSQLDHNSQSQTKKGDTSSPMTNKDIKNSPNSLMSAYVPKTRRQCAQMAFILKNTASSKQSIQYNNGKRHLPGTRPKTNPPQAFRKKLPDIPGTAIISSRIQLLEDFATLHKKFQEDNLRSPRDDWEKWIDDYISVDKDSDRAFMCLIVILMSSSTSDRQLSSLVPGLFKLGLTSSKATIEIAKKYGMDALCSVLSPSGRYYDNAERIVNAADYFIYFHHGRISPTISLHELQCIFGIGHKTASIVLSFAFNRHEGIPSDTHVMRCCKVLHWIPSYVTDGLESSLILQSWLPTQYWHILNPVFGAFGQILSTKQTSELSFMILISHVCPREDDVIQETNRKNNLHYIYVELIKEYQTWS